MSLASGADINDVEDIFAGLWEIIPFESFYKVLKALGLRLVVSTTKVPCPQRIGSWNIQEGGG